MIRRFDVYLVALDPVVGGEMRKTRPCAIVSPDEMNDNLLTVIIAPLTSVVRPYPFRVDSSFAGKAGQVAVDQLRAVDKRRLGRRVGSLDRLTADRVVKAILKTFA